MSDKNKEVDWSASVANELKEEIEELGKKIDAIHDTHMIKYEQWADKLTAWVKNIDELKEDIKNINKILKVITEGRVLELKAHENLEAVLRELGTECKDAIDLISKDEWNRDTSSNLRTYRDKIKRTLKKLDGAPKEQTEKKELKLYPQKFDDTFEKMIDYSYVEEDKEYNEFVEKLMKETEKEASEGEKELKKLAEQRFFDFGMITSKNGELIDYTPSQFIRDYAKEHPLFSIFGLMFPLEEDSKKEECLLDKPHASAVSVERKLIEKCQCPKHKDSGDDDKEFYELYLQDKDQYYFKKTTHPFTEINNMVNLGIGEMKVKRELLRETYEVLEHYYHELNLKRDDSGILSKKTRLMKLMDKLSKLLLQKVKRD